MKDKYLYLIRVGLVTLFYFVLMTSALSNHIVVKGRVVAAGKGVEAVMITDGVNFAKTDNQGNYKIETSSDRDFIYYTLPDNFTSPLIDGVPQFYQKINRNQKEQKIDFELNKSTVSQYKHAMVLWADPQVAEEKEFELLEKVKVDVGQTVRSLASQMPVHAICAGDIVFDKHDLFRGYKNVIKDLNVPFYHVIGNHDLDYNERSNELSDKTYSAEFGPSHYSFNVGKIHYVVLKNVFYYGYSYRYIGYIDEKQLSWLEKDLQNLKPGSTVILSMHIPTIYGESQKPYSFDYQMSNEVLNRKALFRILKQFNAHILAGHSHTQWNAVIEPNLMEHVHAAACGAWWQGEVATDGSPKGYTVYTFDGDSVSWYFKGVGLDKSEQFKIYETGVDQDFPEHFIANVYNYDPAWKVFWYEDGILKGEMQQYWGKDPFAASIYLPGKNVKYRWMSASETNHLFKAKPEKRESKITIVVHDRFGNKHQKDFQNTILVKKSSSNTWKLVWNDEFNYVGLPDDSKWSFDTQGNDWGWGNNEAQYYTDKDSANAWVDNGILTIKAIKKAVKNKRFTSARLVSKGKGDWQYGRFEIRAKLPTGRGTWPAIWMLPTDWEYGGWPESGEIDIMENVGYQPDSIFGSTHSKSYNHIIGTQKTKGIYSSTSYKDFHVYALEWDADECRVYMDNVQYFSFKNEYTGHEAFPFDKRFHIILNLAIGGNWGGMYGIDEHIFPHKFLIDYVRVYQRE